MYTIVGTTKKTKVGRHDFVYDSFLAFYKMAEVTTVSLEGQLSVGIVSREVQEVLRFIDRETDFHNMIITIYMPVEQVRFLELGNPGISIKDNVRSFDVFKGICSEKNLLFKKGVDITLYNSIEHEYNDMYTALSFVAEKFGAFTEITEKMIAPYFILNKIVYPRTVVLNFLWMSKVREIKLKQCVDSVGEDVALWASVKNVEELLKQKAAYFSKGVGSRLIKSIDTRRLLLMYRVFVTEREHLDDVTLLYYLYERGLSSYDFIQR